MCSIAVCRCVLAWNCARSAAILQESAPDAVRLCLGAGSIGIVEKSSRMLKNGMSVGELFSFSGFRVPCRPTAWAGCISESLFSAVQTHFGPGLCELN
jgi:hypothetical protein